MLGLVFGKLKLTIKINLKKHQRRSEKQNLALRPRRAPAGSRRPCATSGVFVISGAIFRLQKFNLGFCFFFKSSIALVNVLNPSTAFLNVLPPLYLSFWVCSYRLAFFSLRVTSLPARWMPDRSALHCHTRADQTSAEDQKRAVAGLCSPFRAPTPSCPGLPGLHAGPLTQRHRQALCGSPILGLPSGDASQAVS